MAKEVGRRRYNKIIGYSVLGFLAFWYIVVLVLTLQALFLTQELIQIMKVESLYVQEQQKVQEEIQEEVQIIPPQDTTSTESVSIVSRSERKSKVTPLNFSVLTPSLITTKELENRLNTDFKPLAHVFVQAEEVTGINAVVLASIAALESGWGKSTLAQSHNNLFGWTDSSSPSGFKYFESKETCIMYIAKRLKTNYLTEGGKYFNGYSLEAINIKYCTLSDWKYKVATIANDLEGNKYGGV